MFIVDNSWCKDITINRTSSHLLSFCSRTLGPRRVCRCLIAEVYERCLVLAHQVNNDTQRLYGHLVALQSGDNDQPQLFDDTGMAGRGDGNIRECGHNLDTEHGQLLGQDVFLGEAP